MPSNLSDNESSTGSSGHKKEPLRYRCSGCSQMFASKKALSEHEADSEISRVSRNILKLLQSQPPTRTNGRPALSLAPPNHALVVGSASEGIGINNRVHHQQPRRGGSHRHHPYRRRTSPVAEEDYSSRTRDFLSRMEGPKPTGRGDTSDHGCPQRIVTDPIKGEELDLNLKL